MLSPESGIPPNIAPKSVTQTIHLQICDLSATLIGQLAIVTIFGAILGGIPLFGVCPISKLPRETPHFVSRKKKRKDIQTTYIDALSINKGRRPFGSIQQHHQ